MQEQGERASGSEERRGKKWERKGAREWSEERGRRRCR